MSYYTQTINDHVRELFDSNEFPNSPGFNNKLLAKNIEATDALAIMTAHAEISITELTEKKKELFGSLMWEFSQYRPFFDIGANYALPAITSPFIFKYLIIPGINSPIQYPEETLSNNGCSVHNDAMEVRNPRVWGGVTLLLMASLYLYAKRNKMLDYSQNILRAQHKITFQEPKINYLKKLLQEAQNRHKIESNSLATGLDGISEVTGMEDTFEKITNCKLGLDEAISKLHKVLNKLKGIKTLLNRNDSTILCKEALIETIETMMFDFLNQDQQFEREDFKINDVESGLDSATSTSGAQGKQLNEALYPANPTSELNTSKPKMKINDETMDTIILSPEKMPRLISPENTKDKATFLIQVANNLELRQLNKLQKYNYQDNNIYSHQSNNSCSSTCNEVVTKLTTLALAIWFYVETLLLVKDQVRYYGREGTPRGNAPIKRQYDEGCSGKYLQSIDPELCCRRTQFEGEGVGYVMLFTALLVGLPTAFYFTNYYAHNISGNQQSIHPKKRQVIGKKVHLDDSEIEKIIDITNKFLNGNDTLTNSITKKSSPQAINKAQNSIKREIKKLKRLVKNGNGLPCPAFDETPGSADAKYELVADALFQQDIPLAHPCSFYGINPDGNNISPEEPSINQ